MKGKYIITWLLIIVIGITPLYAKENLSAIRRADLTLEQMTYEHLEYSEIQQLLTTAEAIIKQKDEKAFYEWEENYYRLYCKLQEMIQLVHLKYELNTDQTDYFNEYLYSVDLLGKMKSGYIALFEEDDESLSENMSQYYALSIERDKLVDSYYNQQMNVKIKLEDEDKTIIEVLTADSLSKAQKLAYYDKWYSEYNQRTGEIFLKLVAIDNQIAKLQGYDSYADYMYKGYDRAYTVEESKVFFANVKKTVPALLAKLYQLSQSSSELRNYTYQDEDSLLTSIQESFINKHSGIEEAYNYLRQYKLYDITPRDNKESGGFTVYLDGVNEPFILLNYSSDYQTVLSFIHEFGHFLSYFETGDHQGGLDLDETYSQALELLAIPHYKEILGSEEMGEEAGLYVIESLVEAIIDGCLYDEFLQKVYEMPELTVEEMNQLYTDLAKEYGLLVDRRSWSSISHNFEMPFYYLSYSVSAVAALEIWNKSLENAEEGFKTYLNLIQAGQDHGFTEALEQVGLSSPLEENTLNQVLAAVEQYFITEKVSSNNQAA